MQEMTTSTSTTAHNDAEADEIVAELSSLEREMYKLAERAYRKGYGIWAQTPEGDFPLYLPGNDLVDFVLHRGKPEWP